MQHFASTSQAMGGSGEWWSTQGCCVGIVNGSLLGKRTGARLANRWDDARRCIQYEQAGRRLPPTASNYHGVVHNPDARAVSSAVDYPCSLQLVREDLIDAEHDVGEEERAFDWVSATTSNTPGTQMEQIPSPSQVGDFPPLPPIIMASYTTLMHALSLLDAEHDVGEEERAFDWVSATTSNTPGTQNDGACDGPSQVGDFPPLPPIIMASYTTLMHALSLLPSIIHAASWESARAPDSRTAGMMRVDAYSTSRR
jgi:hypothetical protein